MAPNRASSQVSRSRQESSLVIRVEPHRPAREQAVWAERAGGPWPEASARLQELSAMSSTNRSAVGLRAASSPPNTKILLPIFVACRAVQDPSGHLGCRAVASHMLMLPFEQHPAPKAADLVASLGGMHHDVRSVEVVSSSARLKLMVDVHATQALLQTPLARAMRPVHKHATCATARFAVHWPCCSTSTGHGTTGCREDCGVEGLG